jgi:glycosyltransferase involved in cell wall biosynthesis
MDFSPKLSICIPTYNRAPLLKSALLSLAPQVAQFTDKVELIVSDNCSRDDTPAVVAEAQTSCPIRYHRNAENIGAARNGVLLITQLAQGEFAWFLGDDDIVRPDGVARVLAVLEAHPEIDYVFVNTSPRLASTRHAFDHPVTGLDFPDLLPTKGKRLEDRYVEKWEELLDPEVDEIFLASMMCPVYRLALIKNFPYPMAPETEYFSSLEYSYSVVQAYTMIGHKAYYIGYPCTIAFWGDQKWMRYVPLLILVRLQELLDLYHRQGVPSARVEKCRLALLQYSATHLGTMLYDIDPAGRKYFSFRRFLWRNRHHPVTLLRVLLEARQLAKPTKVGRFILAGIAAPKVDRSLWRKRMYRLRHDPWGLALSVRHKLR